MHLSKTTHVSSLVPLAEHLEIFVGILHLLISAFGSCAAIVEPLEPFWAASFELTCFSWSVEASALWKGQPSTAT